MKLLLVEDDEQLASAMAQGLREEGHEVDVCTGGADAIAQAVAVSYDLIILDWLLPQVDGLTVLQTWRNRGLSMPVLMLTARGTVADRVTGLRNGADDYMIKPFDFEELLARIDVLRRRMTDAPVPQVAEIALDTARRTMRCRGKEVALTAREFALALVLHEHENDVCPRANLLADVWGADYEGDPHVVDVYVGYLRRKLADAGAVNARIETVRGIGFSLRTDRSAKDAA